MNDIVIQPSKDVQKNETAKITPAAQKIDKLIKTKRIDEIY